MKSVTAVGFARGSVSERSAWHGFFVATHQHDCERLEGYQSPDTDVEQLAISRFEGYPSAWRAWAILDRCFGGNSGTLRELVSRQHDAALNVIIDFAPRFGIDPKPIYEGGLLCRELLETAPSLFHPVSMLQARSVVSAQFPEGIVNHSGVKAHRDVLVPCGMATRQLKNAMRRVESSSMHPAAKPQSPKTPQPHKERRLTPADLDLLAEFSQSTLRLGGKRVFDYLLQNHEGVSLDDLVILMGWEFGGAQEWKGHSRRLNAKLAESSIGGEMGAFRVARWDNRIVISRTDRVSPVKPQVIRRSKSTPKPRKR